MSNIQCPVTKMKHTNVHKHLITYRAYSKLEVTYSSYLKILDDEPR
jgi:hypothetical protein